VRSRTGNLKINPAAPTASHCGSWTVLSTITRESASFISRRCQRHNLPP
jgi:hypothetical protein